MRRLAIVLAVSACGSTSGAPSDATPDPDTHHRHDAAVVVDAPVIHDAPTTAAALPYRGVNLAGADFGSVGGAFGTAYTYPDPHYVSGYTSPTYFRGKGMTTFRLPFLWERIQPTLGGALNAAEVARLDTTVADLTAQGTYVLLDPHNYARYNGQVIGGGSVSDAQFANLWTQLAQRYKANSHVLFGLMNEPHDLPTEQWRDAANAAIAAVRATGATNLITVPGNAYTGAHAWTQNYYGTANSVAMLGITDPLDNYVFEVHQYLDADFSGTSATCASATVGAAQLAAFTTWLETNHKRAIIGEFGGGANATCESAVDGMLAAVEAHSDAYVGWVWWAGGPWWGSSYFLNLEPTSSGDAPQMATLVKHLH